MAFPVFKIGVLNTDLSKNEAGVANAILIDRNNGIFVTNAHVADPFGHYKTTEHRIYLPHIESFVKANSSHRWFNWRADLAYIQLTEDLSAYPDTPIRSLESKGGRRIQVVGYVGKEYKTPTVTKGWVINPRSNFGVTVSMTYEMLNVEEKTFVENSDLAALYESYIRIGLDVDDALIPAMSGSVLLDRDGHIAGIISRGGWGRMGLAIPATEFNTDCVLNSLRPRESRLPRFLKNLASYGWRSRPS